MVLLVDPDDNSMSERVQPLAHHSAVWTGSGFSGTRLPEEGIPPVMPARLSEGQGHDWTTAVESGSARRWTQTSTSMGLATDRVDRPGTDWDMPRATRLMPCLVT